MKKTYSDKYLRKAKEAKVVRRIVLLVVALIVVFSAALILTGYFYVKNALEPVDPGNHHKINVMIESGTSVEGIAKTLDKKGLIKDARIFQYYVKYKNYNGFKAGYYTFTPSMDIDKIIGKIVNGKTTARLTMTFPEGLRLVKIASIISQHTNLDKKDILKKMKNRK